MTPVIPADTVDTVDSVMTRCPIAVRADAPLRTVAATLSRNAASAVPVLDEHGRPVGVVSEIDLIRAGPDLDGRTAGEVMSDPVLTVPADESLPSAARRLADAGVRRLFVVDSVDGDRLVGVLSRRDLLRDFLRDDDAIRVEVEQEVRALLGRNEFVNVSVHDGVVLLLGRVGWRSELAHVTEVAGAVTGVVEVRNRMGFFWDDETAPARRRFARSAR